LSCSAHFSWVVVFTLFECVVTHILFWVCCHSSFFSVLSLIFYFECVITLVTDRFVSPFLCNGPSSTSIKLFFSVSTHPQLLEVESSGDVGIFKPNSVTSCVIVWFFSFLFSHFFDCYILVRIESNWIIFCCHYTWTLSSKSVYTFLT
jgi:hypothetical protein